MNWVILPFLLPLLTGVVALFFPCRLAWRRAWFIASSAAQLGLAGLLLAASLAGEPLVLVTGGWAAAA